jgi:transcriptional regulator
MSGKRRIDHDRLRALRAKGLSQNECARLLFCTQARVSQIEHNYVSKARKTKRRPSLGTRTPRNAARSASNGRAT